MMLEMPPAPRPSLLACALVAGVVGLPLLAVPPAATTGAAPDRVVRLEPEAGSPVRAAEAPLAPGLTRLRTTAYAMVGATWHGPAPAISVRTAPGAPWQRLTPLGDHRPSADSGEGRPGLHAADLIWTGPSAGIDVRVTGEAHRDLELVLIDPGELASDDDAAAAPRALRTTADTAPRPDLRSRDDWGADPSWRNGRPRYNDRLQQVHVHHTATGNSYRRADVPAILRGMYRYHTHTLGWFDIGYNFLVDRFGRTWVGRSGGPERLVRGAHTLGFNTTSVGVAMIGNLDRRRPWRDAVRAVAGVAAWKLDRHGRDALGKVRVTSTGSDKYDDGERVRLPVIDGHRDTNDTACPGQRLYDRLPSIRRRAQRRIDRFS